MTSLDMQPPAPAQRYDATPFRSQRNGVGVASLIVGVAAAALSLIPFAIAFTWLPALAALVLGVIGLALPRRPRRAAGWGIALSVLTVVLGIVSTSVAIGAVTSPPVAEQPAPEAPTAEAPAPADPAPEQPAPQQPAPQQPAKSQYSIGQQNAIDKANSYLSFTSFSRSGLIEQLEFEGYGTDEATFAVDTVAPDWNVQAAKKAQSYLDMTSFSRAGLIEQLVFEGFTQEQAAYGVAAVGY